MYSPLFLENLMTGTSETALSPRGVIQLGHFLKFDGLDFFEHHLGNLFAFLNLYTCADQSALTGLQHCILSCIQIHPGVAGMRVRGNDSTLCNFLDFDSKHAHTKKMSILPTHSLYLKYVEMRNIVLEKVYCM